MAFCCRLLGRRYLLWANLVDDAVLNYSPPQSLGKLSSTVCAVAEVFPNTARHVAERLTAAALRVAMSDGAGGIDEAHGTSLKVRTVVHDDSHHQLLAHRALDLLFVKQRLLQLLRALGAVAQMLPGGGH